MDASDDRNTSDIILNIAFIILSLAINGLYQKPWFAHLVKVVPGAYLLNKSGFCILVASVILIVCSCTFARYMSIKLLVGEAVCAMILRDELRFLGHDFVDEVPGGLTIYYKMTIAVTIVMSVILLLRYVLCLRSRATQKADMNQT